MKRVIAMIGLLMLLGCTMPTKGDAVEDASINLQGISATLAPLTDANCNIVTGAESELSEQQKETATKLCNLIKSLRPVWQVMGK